MRDVTNGAVNSGVSHSESPISITASNASVTSVSASSVADRRKGVKSLHILAASGTITSFASDLPAKLWFGRFGEDRGTSKVGAHFCIALTADTFTGMLTEGLSNAATTAWRYCANRVEGSWSENWLAKTKPRP